jgi:hypothetical protein
MIDIENPVASRQQTLKVVPVPVQGNVEHGDFGVRHPGQPGQ